jgi:CBS domain-containing protein
LGNETTSSAGGGDFTSMLSPVVSVIRRAPITVPMQASLREALATMDRMRIGSIVVTDQESGQPVGIFTLRDLLHRVVLDEGDLDQPIACVMTAGLLTLKPNATAYQAALTMARRGVRHLVVVDGDKLLGIVSQNDLFTLQRAGVTNLSEEIRSAPDLAALRQAAEEIRRLARGMLAQGTGAETLTHFVSTLNDVLTSRIIEMVLDQCEVPDVRWCWIALGSEGRLEQTFSTDQDNGIIFFADRTSDAPELRERFLPFARRVNEMLDACGFPLCQGKIMASNPEWCLSLGEWERKFAHWIDSPEPQALLSASIFFDFRALYGDQDLADRLRQWLLDAVDASPVFLRHMAQNAVSVRPPLGVIRDFVFDDSREFPRTLELKKYGARIFIDAARIMSLAHHVDETSTAQRLRAISEHARFASDDLAAMVDGFYFIQLLRLRRQAGGDAREPNRIDPAALNELDRQILKEAFKQAKKLQQRLALEYRLDY